MTDKCEKCGSKDFFHDPREFGQYHDYVPKKLILTFECKRCFHPREFIYNVTE